MANRATENEVKDLIDTDLTVSQVTPFLNTAHALVDVLLLEEGYEESLLALIESWLAAHLVAVRDPRVSEVKVGEGQAKFHGKSGLRLEHTPYGQQVLLLDHHGVFAATNTTKRPFEVKVIG